MRKATLTELNVIRKMIKQHIDNTLVHKSEIEEEVEAYNKKVDAAITAKLQGLKINDLRRLLRDIYTRYYIQCDSDSCNLGISRETSYSLVNDIRNQKRNELRKLFNALPHIEMKIVRKEPVDLDALISRVEAIVNSTPQK